MPTLRNAALTVSATVLCGVAAAFALLSSVAYLGDARGVIGREGASQHLTVGEVHALGVGAVLLGLFLAALAVRVAMCGAAITAKGVVVRRLTESEVVPLADVAGVVAQPTGLREAIRPAIVTLDGRTIGVGWAAVGRPTPQFAGRLRQFEDAVFGGRPRPDVRSVLARSHRLAAHPAAPLATTVWQSPPNWPPAPPGWTPPPGWLPPPTWPPPPAGWQWWRLDPGVMAVADQGLDAISVAPVVDSPADRWLRRETVAVMAAFLIPSVAAAIVGLIQGLVGHHRVDNFALPIPGHPTISLLILILSYVPLAAAVPVALLLLARSGTSMRRLGFEWRSLPRDIIPAIGMAVAAYLFVVLISLVLRPLLTSSAANNVHESHVPAYFVVYALILAATTAVTEETFVNGYLLTRLAQFGWRPWPAFALSLALRTSYHAYYGAGIIATIPFGWLVTRSFQKRQRLPRPILTHFLYDATLLTIAVLTS